MNCCSVTLDTRSMNLLRAWLHTSPLVSDVKRIIAWRSTISQKKDPSSTSSTLSAVLHVNSKLMYMGLRSTLVSTKSRRSRRRPRLQSKLTIVECGGMKKHRCSGFDPKKYWSSPSLPRMMQPSYSASLISGRTSTISSSLLGKNVCCSVTRLCCPVRKFRIKTARSESMSMAFCFDPTTSSKPPRKTSFSPRSTRMLPVALSSILRYSLHLRSTAVRTPALSRIVSYAPGRTWPCSPFSTLTFPVRLSRNRTNSFFFSEITLCTSLHSS
mmetsp:Transcript_39680/g.81259  ORF Transcript_39680/g.81259 Transcript_39680/m.81259 type:complete len:270 (-) Transcript_39680:325-1134(-)